MSYILVTNDELIQILITECAVSYTVKPLILSHSLVGNKNDNQSDVVEAPSFGAALTTSLFSTNTWL